MIDPKSIWELVQSFVEVMNEGREEKCWVDYETGDEGITFILKAEGKILARWVLIGKFE